MYFDIFFSISHTPVDGKLPSEKELWQNFFSQVKMADELGYQTAWIAESHLSSQTQKQNKNPVIPHWQGEVGLNADIFQLAHMIFDRTQRINVGSAVMNLLTNGGPIAAAERLATFLSFHGLRPDEKRKLKVGFSAGRFDYMARAYGVKPRSSFEEKFWPAIKQQIFAEASEIFLRLLRKEELSSDDIALRYLEDSNFQKPEEWKLALETFNTREQRIPLKKFYHFEKLKVVPQEFDLSCLDLILGSHVPALQTEVNQYLPVKVFNLSITKPEVIEATHQRMKNAFHPLGGDWKRSYMPRTTFVFINEEKGLNPKTRSEKAREEAKKALSAYWQAIEGTIDPNKIKHAAENALVGTADEISQQMEARFHKDDTLMLWFDFFNHDNNRVIENMIAFKEKVAARWIQ